MKFIRLLFNEAGDGRFRLFLITLVPGAVMAFVIALVTTVADYDRSESAQFVLLGSVASEKYVQILGSILGGRLVFPAAFVGRGDMSRGGLLLRAAAAAEELDYVPVIGAVRRGPRPPKLAPLGRR